MDGNQDPEAAWRLAPATQDADEVRRALADASVTPPRALTPEELRRWAETGEWPESSG